MLTAPEGINLWADDEESNKIRVDAETLVASVRRDSEEGILLPYGWELKLLTSGSSRQIDISNTIERYDNRIAITLLSDIILLGSKSGSFALADTKQSLLAASLQSQLANIADVLNAKAVPDLFRANNVTDLSHLPKIMPTKIQNPTLSEVALMLRAMDLNIAGDHELINHLRHILSMPDLDGETFKEVYAPQVTSGASANNLADNFDDSAENVFEQNNLNYT